MDAARRGHSLDLVRPLLLLLLDFLLLFVRVILFLIRVVTAVPVAMLTLPKEVNEGRKKNWNGCEGGQEKAERI